MEWTHAITTGVDWKSLVMPACLPITTDFLPDTRTLQQDYVTYAYDLLPEDQGTDYIQQRSTLDDDFKKNNILTSDRVYMELICQRLQQGFQLILQPRSEVFNSDKCEYILSIGRIYHELLLKDNKITITYYHPRHPYNAKNIKYCYRIRTPDNETYGISWVEFAGEKLESYKWNYLDNYICLRGDSDYQLIESLKYWRFRLLVLPTMQSITKKIIDKYLSNKEDDFNCDLYHAFKEEDRTQFQAGFLKLIETINRIKRPNKENIRNTQTTVSCRYAPLVSQVSTENYNFTLNNRLIEVSENQSKIDHLSLKTDNANDLANCDLEKILSEKSSPILSEIIAFMMQFR